MKFIQSTYIRLSILLYLTTTPLIYCVDNNTPRLTVIIEVDQFAYHYIPRIQKYLTGGIKKLLDNGIRYTNAYWPHAMPSTAIGHTAINTGTFANYHGVINNSWFDKNLKKIECDSTPAKDSAVFSPEGIYDYGKSANNIMVDGISDQLVLASTKDNPINVYALSHKSRSAIGNAGKLGKAIWFDAHAGQFTSSKAYFDTFPSWIDKFNSKLSKRKLLQYKWKPYFDLNSKAYGSANDMKISPLQRTLSVLGDKADKLYHEQKKPYEAFLRTPAANTLLLNLAKALLNNHSLNNNNRIVLWISLSPLDKLGHFYGPYSKEVLDMMYHLDYQLKNFFDYTKKMFKESEILYILTADHGVEPMPEYTYNKGLKHARRILIPELCKKIENHIQKKYNVSIKCAIKTPQIYLDKNFDLLEKNQQKQLLSDVKKIVENIPGIRTAWAYDELINACIDKNTIDYYFKNQQYRNRSGQIIFQVLPYTQMTKHPAGTAHRTPYEWNTHVPLIVYQKGNFELKEINQRVSPMQLPNTLAQIHNVPRPSASTCKLLPGMFPTIKKTKTEKKSMNTKKGHSNES